MTLAIAAAAVAALLVGTGLGLGYFWALGRTARLYAAGSGMLAPALLTAGRMAGAVLVLGAAAKAGAMPLLAMALGFLVARAVALRAVRGGG
jgi:N-ATPase, AtpR subunit